MVPLVRLAAVPPSRRPCIAEKRPVYVTASLVTKTGFTSSPRPRRGRNPGERSSPPDRVHAKDEIPAVYGFCSIARASGIDDDERVGSPVAFPARRHAALPTGDRQVHGPPGRMGGRFERELEVVAETSADGFAPRRRFSGCEAGAKPGNAFLYPHCLPPCGGMNERPEKRLVLVLLTGNLDAETAGN